MDDMEERRRRYTEGSGLGEALLPPVRVGDCEVSLHRPVRPDPLWTLMEQDAQDDGPQQWFLFSFPEDADDDPQGQPSAQIFSAPRGEVPEAIREVWGDRPTTPPPPAIGDIQAVALRPDGSIGQGVVGTEVGFTSWESGAAMYGVLPARAASIQAMAGDAAIPVHVGNGLFLAAIPAGADVTVIFRAPQGGVLKAHYFAGPEGEFGLEEVLAGEGTATGALLYSTAFCPPTEEVDGLIFIKFQVAYPTDEKARQIRRYLEEVGEDTREVQRSFNLVEPVRLFCVDQPEVTDEEERLLAEALAQAWRAWLHWRYPDRRFVVELVGRDETGAEIGVTFHEDRE